MENSDIKSARVTVDDDHSFDQTTSITQDLKVAGVGWLNKLAGAKLRPGTIFGLAGGTVQVLRMGL